MDEVSSMPLRILHCPWNIAGHPSTLALHERELGAASHSVALHDSHFGFAADEIILMPGMLQKDEDRARRRLLTRAIRNFDVIHFNFGQTILESSTNPKLNGSIWRAFFKERDEFYHRVTWMIDLPLLRICNKVVVMTYQGDDARQGDYCREHFQVNAADEVDYYSAESDEWKRRAIRRVARYADRIYALNPDLLHVLPPGSQFLPYANVDPREWVPTSLPRNSVPRVVHAPTNRGVKGTRFILDAVEELRREGITFEFVLVENMNRSEARLVYESADILVDQLLLGWYGSLAVELMALSKPVVCYLRSEDLKFVPEAMRQDLPIVNACPQTLKMVLRDLLTRRLDELPELGRRGRKFIEKWHDPRDIAKKTTSDYQAVLARKRHKWFLPSVVSSEGI